MKSLTKAEKKAALSSVGIMFLLPLYIATMVYIGCQVGDNGEDRVGLSFMFIVGPVIALFLVGLVITGFAMWWENLYPSMVEFFEKRSDRG